RPRVLLTKRETEGAVPGTDVRDGPLVRSVVVQHAKPPNHPPGKSRPPGRRSRPAHRPGPASSFSRRIIDPRSLLMRWFIRLFGKRSSVAAGPRCSPPVRPQVEALEDRQVPTVSFFGGNLLPQVQAQALYLGNEFTSAPASAQPATLDAFLKDLTGGPYLQAL